MALAHQKQLKYSKKFTAKDWVDNQIVIIPSGSPTGGQLGPHRLPTSFLVETTVYKYLSGTTLKEVGLDILQLFDGKIVVKKAALIPDFDGIVSIKASRYEQ
jgi:hypothetical protein